MPKGSRQGAESSDDEASTARPNGTAMDIDSDDAEVGSDFALYTFQKAHECNAATAKGQWQRQRVDCVGS